MTMSRLHSIGWWYWLAMVVLLASEVAGSALAAGA